MERKDDDVHAQKGNGSGGEKDKGHTFPFQVDDRTFEWPHPRITGAEIMTAAGIPPEVGLIWVKEDGSEEVVHPDQVINLAELNGRFKRAPRYKRG